MNGTIRLARLILAILLALPLLGHAQDHSRSALGALDQSLPEPWATTKAWTWYTKTARPLRGVNYLPRTAVNSTEMWQAETFDPKTIEQELGWARDAGYNSLRVFLQFIVWRNDPDGLLKRIDQFLVIAHRNGFRTMLVPFCDCSFAGKDPYPGKQADPVPGVHNSGWVPSPGLKRVTDRTEWPEIEQYIKAVVGRFAQDERVVVWDLYNEPGNSNMGTKSLPLVEACAGWARSMRPAQPLTFGLWTDFGGIMSQRLIELSDVVSFHAYDAPAGVVGKIKHLQGTNRPLLCTEWLHRAGGNTFAAVLPLLTANDVGWYHWGLVAGRTQTYMPWGSKKGDPMPALWQHDVFHPDGRPFDAKEIEQVKALKKDEGAK